MSPDMLVTVLSVVVLSWVNNQSSEAAADSASPNAERQKFLRTLQHVRENFKAADEDGDERITLGQFIVFVDANAEINFARSKQIKRLRAYQRAFNVDFDADGTVS